MMLVDMKVPKLTPAQRKKQQSVGLDSQEEYPWGLRLRLQREQLEALGIDVAKLEVGADVRLQAVCSVVSVSQERSKGQDARQGLDLQVTKLGIDPNDGKGFSRGFNSKDGKEK